MRSNLIGVGIFVFLPAYADSDFGAWSVSQGVAPNNMPICIMLEKTPSADGFSSSFMVVSALPTTVEMSIMRPIGGLGGLTKGQKFTATHSLNRVTTGTGLFTVLDNGFVASGEATTSELRNLAHAVQSGQTWLWTIDAPEAGIVSLRIPFEGFATAVNALADCGLKIGVAF